MRNVFEGASAISKGLGNALGNIVETSSLPAIRGQWYFVDPTSGASTSGGKSLGNAVDDIETAYGLAVDGDGIAVISYGATSAATTSYLKTGLTWAKNGITVVGVCAPVKMFPRARIANKKITTTANQTVTAGALKVITRATGSYITDGWEVGMTALTAGDQTTSSVVTAVSALALTVTDDLVASAAGITSVTSTVVDLITVTGANNRFYNLSFWNGGSSATEIGGLNISGSRNYFEGCHIVGAADATPGAVANAYSLKINGGQENTFVDCTIGTDSVLWAAANSPVLLDGGVWRTRFENCTFLVQSETAGTGAINSADADSCSGYQMFKGCTFLLWNTNGVGTSTAAVIGTKPTSGQLIFDQCTMFGWAAWGAAGMSGCVYVGSPTYAASGAGGIATTL